MSLFVAQSAELMPLAVTLAIERSDFLVWVSSVLGSLNRTSKKIDEKKLNPKCNIDTKLRFDLFVLSKKKGSAKRHLVLRYIGLYGHKTSRDYGLFCECRPERKRLSYPINFAKFLISPFDFPCETPSFLLRFFALYSLGLTKDPINWENFTGNDGFAEKTVS